MTGSLKRRLSDDITDNNDTMQSTTLTDEQAEKMFGNMRLKRILKENHERDINEIAFCFNKTTTSIIKPLDTTEEDDEEENFEEEEEEEFDIFDKLNIDQVDASNILGTLGGAQINVYDNEHFGNHLDIMSNFNLGDGLDEEEDYKEKILNSFCWIHRKDDAIIATGGADGDVHVLSIALSNEIAVLKGHTKPIVDVKAYPQDNQHIISVSKDGTMRLWNVEKQTCVAIFEYECNVVCFHPSGETFITGTTKGELREWKIPALIGSMDEDDDEPVVVGKKSSRILKKMHGDCTIDCIRYANGYVLSKSTNGRMEYWDPTNEQTIRSFRVKTGENYCRFDVSVDDTYFCVGSNHGSVFIYNLKTGKQVAELSHRRSSKAIRCCVFTRDCRQILCGGLNGFLWRYDYITDRKLNRWARWSKS